MDKKMSIGSFLFENALFSIAPICALISARYGKKTWLQCEIVISTVFGLALCLKPELITSYVLNSPLKDYHHFLCALYGCYLIYSVLSSFLLLDSMDDSVFHGHFWAKVISNSLLIADNLFSYIEGIHWNYKVFCLFTSYYVTSFLINAYYLHQTKKPWGRHPYDDKINYIARLDTYFFLITGIVMYAFPERCMKELKDSPNESYKSLFRASGAILLSLSLQSYSLAEFLFLRDKKNFMLSRFLGSLMKTFVIFYGYFWLELFSFKSFSLFMTLNTSYNLMVLYGYLKTPNDPKTKSKE